MGKENLKERLKKLLVTGAVVTGLTISLVGCALVGPNYPNYPSQPDYSQSQKDETYQEDHNQNGTLSPDANYNTSYNSFLYATGSLSDVVGAGAFGYSSSKTTDNADRRLTTGELVPIKIDMTNSDYNTFAKWVRGKDVVYVYADMYNIDYAQTNINKYQSQVNKQEHQHTDLITSIDKIPTYNQVYNKIEKNSAEYLKTHPGYYRLDSEYVRLIAEIIIDTVEENYDDLTKEDITRIYCMLNDVKAVGIDSTDFSVNDLKQMYNARVTDDGTVILDTEMIKSLRGDNIYERTITHEVAHLFQRMCPDHVIKGLTQIGSSQYVESFDQNGGSNSLHFQWLYEAAAEQMSMNQYGAKTPLVYANMVGYLRTLDLITLIRPGYEQDSIAVSQMSTNPNKIYEIFGAKTEEEKKEIAHMLYSICYIQTEREDFVTIYEQKNGTIEGKETTVKKIMKESIAQTMTKYFYLNLSERVANGDITLQDAFYLINTFEASLNLHIVYDDAERYEYNDESISFYIETQNKFFEYVAKGSNMTFEEVVNQFNDYSLVIKTSAGYERNYSFKWLTDEEKDYVGTALTTNIEHLTTNIRNLKYIKENQKQAAQTR